MAGIHYDLPSLRALCSLSRARSFTEAASELALTPSAFSRRIAKLEETVGQSLVTRTTRNMALNQAGVQLVERAKPLIAALDRTVTECARAARHGSKKLAVGCVSSLAYTLFPCALHLFRKSFPDTGIKLTDGEARWIATAVDRRQVEFGILYEIEPAPHLQIERIGSDDIVLVCSPDHTLTDRQVMPWAELTGYRY